MSRDERVPRWLDTAAAWSWRLLLVAAAVLVSVLFLARLRLVLLPVVAALLLATLLVPVRRFFAARRLPGPLAMLCTVLVFFGALSAIGLLIVPPVVNEFSGVNTTLSQAADDVERWFIEGPLGLDRTTVEDARKRIEESVTHFAHSDGAILDSVQLAGEILAGLILSLVVTFFVVKDGERIQAAFLARVPEAHRARVRAAGAAAWDALGGYLRASAFLGLLEGIIIGGTLWLVGADLEIPVGALTFLAAFFPFVGAVVAGLLAITVAFVSVNMTAAIIVGVVALLVQQFDNDLLAPFVFGKALSLHPLVVVLALSTGAALAGLTGAFLAVPTTAVVLRAAEALRVTDETASASDGG